MTYKTIALIAPLLFSTAVFADWKLNNKDSKLNYVSTKKSLIAETGHFNSLSGVVTNDGKFSLEIALDSVDSNIPIRNARMKEHLFDVKNYPYASVTGLLDLEEINRLGAGESITLNQEFRLELHGKTETIVAPLRVVRLSAAQINVASLKPIIINTKLFDLEGGIGKLKELAGLDSISLAVPVTINLTFEKES